MRSASDHTLPFIAALMSPLGRGAVATWRILGTPDDVSRLPFITAHQTQIAEQPVGRIWFGHWNGEEAVLTRTKTYAWELSIHGGYAAVQRVGQDLEVLGCTLRDGEELLLDGGSTLEAEYLIAATKTVTWTTTEFLLRHPTREWIEELQRWQQLFERSPTVEERSQFVSRCAEWLSWSEFGRHLIIPYTVALVGEPNVGKSSLLNRLAGFERVIVQDRPGTTRDLVEVDASFSGYPFSMTDTAGLRETNDQLESEGINRAHKLLGEVDLILHVADSSSAPSAREQILSKQFPRAMLIAHKSDLPLHPQRKLDGQTLRVSSLTGKGIDQLVSEIVTQLIPRVPQRQTAFPVTDRQIDLLQFLLEHGIKADTEILSRNISELLSQHEHLIHPNL